MTWHTIAYYVTTIGAWHMTRVVVWLNVVVIIIIITIHVFSISLIRYSHSTSQRDIGAF